MKQIKNKMIKKNNDYLLVGKAHQRIIRERKSKETIEDLFGNYWNNINKNIENAVVKEISTNEAKRIILEYEWLGTMGTTQKHFGIFFDGHLGGVVCYGYFQAMNTNSGGHPYAPYVGTEYAKQGIQLSRGACVHWCHPHTGSKLIGKTLKLMKEEGYKYVIAFSDPEAGEIGTLYQATNWHYLGFGNTKHHDIYYKDGKIFLNDRDYYKKYKTRSKKSMEEFVANNEDLEIRLRKPKGRYIYLLGDKKEKKQMMQVLKTKIKPYPKRRRR